MATCVQNIFWVAYLLMVFLSGHSLTTRRDIRGRGTDRPEQEPQTHNTTNIFHLGTRIPDGGNGEYYEECDKVSDPISCC